MGRCQHIFRYNINDTAGSLFLRFEEDAWVELMLNPSEGVLSGVVFCCSAGQRIMTIEAAGLAVCCHVPVETPGAMRAVGECIQSKGDRKSRESMEVRDDVKPEAWPLS